MKTKTAKNILRLLNDVNPQLNNEVLISDTIAIGKPHVSVNTPSVSGGKGELVKSYLDENRDFYTQATEEGGFACEFYNRVMSYIKDKTNDDGSIRLSSLVYVNDDMDIRHVCTLAQMILNALIYLSNTFTDNDVKTIYDSHDQSRIDDFIDKLWSLSKEMFYKTMKTCGYDKDNTDMYFSCDLEDYLVLTKGAFIYQRMEPEALSKYGYTCWASYYFDRLKPEMFKFKYLYNKMSSKDQWIIMYHVQGFDSRINRMMKLIKTNAPDILLSNAPGLAFEKLFFFFTDPIGRTEYFKDYYGFN